MIVFDKMRRLQALMLDHKEMWKWTRVRDYKDAKGARFKTYALNTLDNRTALAHVTVPEGKESSVEYIVRVQNAFPLLLAATAGMDSAMEIIDALNCRRDNPEAWTDTACEHLDTAAKMLVEGWEASADEAFPHASRPNKFELQHPLDKDTVALTQLATYLKLRAYTIFDIMPYIKKATERFTYTDTDAQNEPVNHENIPINSAVCPEPEEAKATPPEPQAKKVKTREETINDWTAYVIFGLAVFGVADLCRHIFLAVRGWF